MLVVVFLVLTVHGRMCTPGEVTVELTECMGSNMRTAVYQTTANCSVPAPKGNLSCGVECPPGTFLGYDTTLNQSSCQLCPSNTYSNGGGILFSGLTGGWSAYQSEFIAYCYISELWNWLFRTDCESWTVSSDGLELVSGNTTRKAWLQSELIYYSKVVKPGNLTIEYRKKTRMYEGIPNGVFLVYLNEISVLEDDSLVSDTYQTVSYPLQPGIVELVIQYEKYNTVGFEDLDAHIRLIELTGTQENARYCSKCVGGRSGKGARKCEPCPGNTYFDGMDCVNCPQGQYSRQGSQSLQDCKVKLPCTEQDYMAEMTGCLEGSSTRKYVWIQPHICDETQGKSLPEPVVGLTCDLCQPGYFHSPVSINTQETACAPCPQGTAATEIDSILTTCETCLPGTFASRVLNYTHWVPLPPQVSNDCQPYTGEVCTETTGWMYTTSGLTSGPQLTTNVYLTLGILTNIIETDAYFVFSWSLGRVYGSSSRLSLEIDGLTKVIITTEDFQATSSRFPLSPGMHVIRLIYHHNTATAGTDWCTIHWTAIKGSDIGGAPTCEKCPSGYYSTQGVAECIACPTGFTSNAEGTDCEQCPPNTYSDIAGNRDGCIPCPMYTVPSANRTYCVTQGDIRVGNKTEYAIGNLTGIKGSQSGLCGSDEFALLCLGTYYGPVHGSNSDFYLSVLNPSSLNLDMYANYDDLSPGYAYGLIDKSHLYLTASQLKMPDSPCVSNSDQMLVNLGSRIQSVLPSSQGVNITYDHGSTCSHSDTYSLSLFLECNKSEGAGFPVYQNTSGCHYSFLWRSRLACPICSISDMSEIRSSCIDGIRYIYYVEGRNCVVRSDQATLYFIESCGELMEVMNTTAALVICGVVVGLLLLAVVVLACFCKVKRQYETLLEHSEPHQERS